MAHIRDSAHITRPLPTIISGRRHSVRLRRFTSSAALRLGSDAGSDADQRRGATTGGCIREEDGSQGRRRSHSSVMLFGCRSARRRSCRRLAAEALPALGSAGAVSRLSRWWYIRTGGSARERRRLSPWVSSSSSRWCCGHDSHRQTGAWLLGGFVGIFVVLPECCCDAGAVWAERSSVNGSD